MIEHEWLTSEDPQRMLRLRRTECCGCFWIAHEDGSVSISAGSRPCAQCNNGPILPYSPFTDRQGHTAEVVAKGIWNRFGFFCSAINGGVDIQGVGLVVA